MAFIARRSLTDHLEKYVAHNIDITHVSADCRKVCNFDLEKFGRV